MAISFHSPSYRASSSDLTISVSPLGLIELADEEFEVHGPRLNRYSHYWAMYLGHHWSYRREEGEPQLTFNYTKAFADYINTFTFGRGVNFRTPKATEAIIPNALHRVWNVDNQMDKVLWEMGQQGGVTGDCFVKVAYEEPFVDPIGRPHPGRVRILVVPSMYAFPEWHPHDRERLVRFKLKYRFWGTAPEGTRQVFTYTEIITDDVIEEYVNDELIDSRPNPLGVIPIVHIPNMPVSGSPWGLADIQDIVGLNREYNEKSLDISDIINYHAAPVTIITGAKASQLEKGPKKIWGGLPKDAQVFNLGLDGADISASMAFLDSLKRSMHEFTGVPESALGQIQPISNTSGVALSIEYQPLVNRSRLKQMQYGYGIERINELVILTLALKEPMMLMFNPTEESDLKSGQYPQLDAADPLTYRTETEFPPPLPTDELIKLNELQAKMALGLESKRGALRELGADFPDEKMSEVFEELQQDIVEQGALDLLRNRLNLLIAMSTGMGPDGTPLMMGGPGGGGEGDVQSAGGPGVTQAAGGAQGGLLPGLNVPLDDASLLNHLVTLAHGTKLAQRRSPEADHEST